MAFGRFRSLVFSPSLSYITSLFPQEILLLAGVLLIMLLSTRPTFTSRDALGLFVLLCAGSAFLVAFAKSGSFGPMVSTPGVQLAKLAIALTFAASALVCYTLCPSGPGSLLVTFSLLGAFSLLSSSDWFFVFLSIELISLASYCLVGLPGTPRSVEGAVKYFAAGALSSCFLLFGVLALFSWQASALLGDLPANESATLLFVTFVLASLLLKVGAAPFHYWVADAYEGSPAFALVFLSVAVKITFFLFLCRVLFGPMYPLAELWQHIIAFSSGASIVVGCLGALFQTRVKRLLAYSSVNNVGFALAGLASANATGLESALLYIAFYCATLLVTLCLVLPGRSVVYVSDMAALRYSYPFLSTLTLFSLAGIPPLTGFWTKLFVLNELIAAEVYWLATLAALGSVVASFYYLSLVRALFFYPSPLTSKPTYSSWACAAFAIPSVLLPLVPWLVLPAFSGLAIGFTS